MAITRANIKRGTAKVTWNSVSFFSRDDIVARHNPSWVDVVSSVHGVIDKARSDFICKIPLRLWGAWENISTIFPSSVLTPTIGSGIYGSSDLPLVILAKNGDQITYHNAQLTRLANLYLGVDSEIFAADVEFTAILADGKNPEEASAYYTIATGQSYTDTTFAKTNFKQQRYNAAWGSVAGFTSFQGHKGWTIDWDLGLESIYNANLGTVDMAITGFRGMAKCIPVEPTMAQIETAANAGANASNLLGRLLSKGETLAADLVITGSGFSATLKNASITEHGYAFGAVPLRNGEVTWETTVGFTTGTAAARAVLS